MSLTVQSPVTGTVVALGGVPDEVFAQGIVGAGLAIAPATEAVEVVAPVAGVIAKVHPHAVVIAADDDHSLLFHLGIDTVQMAGDGFEAFVTDGEQVSAGQHLISWSPQLVLSHGHSTITPVIAMQTPSDGIDLLVEPGQAVKAGDQLFGWP